jgi:pantothenate kinase
MDMEKRMIKAHISKHEIPLLGFDIGGITVKVTYFDIDYDTASYDDLEADYENPVNINLSGDKVENRKKLKVMLNEYLKKISSYSTREFVLKNLQGFLHCYLFSREKMNEFMQKLNNINLQCPFFVFTGAALVNYISKLEEQHNARVIIIPSEDESVVRGVDILHSQSLSEFFYDIELKKMNGLSNTIQALKPVKNIQSEHFYPCLLVIIGTSTTYLQLHSATNYTRLNTSAISGQTFIGLCNAAHRLAKKDEIKSFDNCVKMATEGRSEVYDVTLRQMCDNNDRIVEQFLYLHSFGKQNNNYSTNEFVNEYGELPVSIFGKVNAQKIDDKTRIIQKSAQTSNQIDLNDFSAATLNMICYQIAENMFMYAKLLKLNLVLCSGSFLTTNSTAKMLITKYMMLLSHNRVAMETQKKKLYFIDNEAFLAAIGCINIDCKNFQSINID